MARARKTIICDDCSAEFDIITDAYDEVLYCCFCGADIEPQEDYDDEDEE